MIAASTAATVATSVVIPIVVAAITAGATLLLTRASEATDRRRDRYADAVTALVAWVEFPYRVRRRTDDTPSTLAALAARGHDLQERLACHQAWIAAENSDVAAVYKKARRVIARHVGVDLQEAWLTSPTGTAAAMNLGSWGPSNQCEQAIAEVQAAIEMRFSLKRLTRFPAIGVKGREAQSREALLPEHEVSTVD
jgi:hypothetical protein